MLFARLRLARCLQLYSHMTAAQRTCHCDGCLGAGPGLGSGIGGGSGQGLSSSVGVAAAGRGDGSSNGLAGGVGSLHQAAGGCCSHAGDRTWDVCG
jgi:hypothetical protein